MTGVLGLIDRRFKATDWRDGSIIIPTPLGLAGGGGGCGLTGSQYTG